MSGKIGVIPELPRRSRLASTKAATEMAKAVDASCATSGAVVDLLGQCRTGPEAWQTEIKAVSDALVANETLARLLRAERDRLIMALSSSNGEGQPWLRQAALARLTGVTDSYINRILRAMVTDE